MVGQIVHLVQTDPDSFMAASSMIRAATQQGKFDNVKIGHAEISETNEWPCASCMVGEMKHNSTNPGGSMHYVCDSCGNEEIFP